MPSKPPNRVTPTVILFSLAERKKNNKKRKSTAANTLNDRTYAVVVRGRCNRPRDLPFLAGLGHIRGRDRPKRGDFGGTPRGYPVPPNLPANADCVTRVITEHVRQRSSWRMCGRARTGASSPPTVAIATPKQASMRLTTSLVSEENWGTQGGPPATAWRIARRSGRTYAREQHWRDQ